MQALCPPETFFNRDITTEKRGAGAFQQGQVGKLNFHIPPKALKMEGLESELIIIDVFISSSLPAFFFSHWTSQRMAEDDRAPLMITL